MFARVRLLKGFSKPLLYAIPSSWQTMPHTGSIIRVPLKKQIVPALVLETIQEVKTDFAIRDALCLEKFPRDHNYTSFVQKIADLYFLSPVHFYQRMRTFIFQTQRKTTESFETFTKEEKTTVSHVKLTDEQQVVVDYLSPLIKSSIYAPTLLHGVTGAGKTEVYKKLMQTCVQEKKTVLFLLPEVSLSMQFEILLRNQLPKTIPLFSFHSLTKTSEKKILWPHLLNEKPCVIIGIHLPVFLPISNLGLIIIDEEHEAGFQEKKHPKINSKYAAILRAYHYKIPILLGSATPSLNSLYNLEKRNWRLFSLTKRFSGTFPTIKLVSLSAKKYRQHFWITQELEHAIALRLAKKEQVMIYLNRRGYSFFVQCKQCGFIFSCTNCSVSLTLHKKGTNPSEHILRCHYCDYTQILPTACTSCNASEKQLLKKVSGWHNG